ncbi:MAG: DUF2281 domain-containing protein [Candidatus Coatesbacteria bacterium]|nr:DUF2281 domain-containing protein [Candidatus Coatesbacteria bacterium]
MPKKTDIRLLRADAAHYQREALKWQRYVDSNGLEQSDADVPSCLHSMDGLGWFRSVVLRRRRDSGGQLDLFDGHFEYFPVATRLWSLTEAVIHLEELSKELPPRRQDEVRDFADFLVKEHSNRPRRKPRFDWAGGLKDRRGKCTSVGLQHEASDWRIWPE